MNHNLRRLSPKGTVGDWVCLKCDRLGKVETFNNDECTRPTTEQDVIEAIDPESAN